MTIVNEQSGQTTRDPADNGTHVVRLTIPAKAEYITLCRLALTGFARLHPLSAELLADLKLALTEATSNSVRHAYPDGDGCVEIRYELRGDRLTIEVSDDGTGFDHTGEASLDGLGDLTEGGLGIAIIRSIADELELGRGDDGRGSRLRFVKTLSG
jgi:serine/threonine-protein kinase RsbW